MATLMGIALIVLGVCILAAPLVAGTVTVMLVGILMVLAGLVECIHAFRTTALPRVIWLSVGFATFLCGALVMAHPLFGLSFLTILLVIYFFADGLTKSAAAFHFVAYRGWFVTNGLLSFLLAYLIGSNWPLSGGWALGVLVGINFVFTGIMTLAVGKELSTT